jgi:hypothetical protein
VPSPKERFVDPSHPSVLLVIGTLALLTGVVLGALGEKAGAGLGFGLAGLTLLARYAFTFVQRRARR